MDDERYLRIGELSRRSGVSVDLLRAWERRYGLLEPARSDGGFRLYSDDDVERVRTMQAHLGEGLAAAEAARRALAPEPETAGPVPSGAVEQARRRAHRGPGELRGGARPLGVRPRARRAHARHRARRRRSSVPPRAGRELGSRRDDDRPGALREQHHSRSAARTRPRLGSRCGAACTARLPSGRASRPRAARVRPRPPRAAVGASPTSGRTRRSRPSRSMRARSSPTPSCSRSPTPRGSTHDLAELRRRWPRLFRSLSAARARPPSWPSRRARRCSPATRSAEADRLMASRPALIGRTPRVFVRQPPRRRESRR